MPNVILPLTIVLSSINVLENTIAVFHIVFPLSFVKAAINVSCLARTFPRTVFLLSNINGSVGELNFGNLRGARIKLRLKDSAFVKMILSLSTFFILEVISLKKVPILIPVLPQTMFEPMLKLSFKKQLTISEEFALT